VGWRGAAAVALAAAARSDRRDIQRVGFLALVADALVVLGLVERSGRGAGDSALARRLLLLLLLLRC
jgi:hypothetical protein